MSSLGTATMELEIAIERYERATDRVERAIANHAKAKARLEEMQANSIRARRLAWKKSQLSGK